MKEKIDLSLDRSLEELVASYWEGVNGEIDANAVESFDALENYLNKLGALVSRYKLLGKQYNKVKFL